jgi:hypothetical protein
VGHPLSDKLLVAGEVRFTIDGVEDLRLDDQRFNTKETTSLRISIELLNGTSEEAGFAWYAFEHTLRPKGRNGPTFTLRAPKNDALLVNSAKSAAPRSTFGVNYPVACYEPGLESGKDYVLTVEGLGQTQSTTIKF